MKTLFLSIVLIILSKSIYAQINSNKIKLSENVQDSVLGTDIILKNNEIVFQKTYSSELLKNELVEKLKTHLPTIKNFQLTEVTNQNNGQFSGKITDYIVNYRKYGGKLMGTMTALNYPLVANAIIQVKDNKYRVTVSNFIFKGVQVLSSNYDVALDDGLTQAKRTKIRDNNTLINAAKYLNSELTDLFDIKKSKKIDDF